MVRYVHMEELMIQKAGSLLALILFFSVAASAQQTPKVELFGGYSHLLADLNNTTFNLDGVHVSAAENINSWIGGVLDFSSHFGSSAGTNLNAQSIMYGPRFSYRKLKAVTPSAHALFGAIRASAGFDGISKPSTRFTMGLGGELDIRLSDKVAFRVIQADYMPTRFMNVRQDNIRISTGFVFRFPRW